MKKTAIIDLDSVCYTIAHPEKELGEQGNPLKIKSKKGNWVFVYKEKTLDEMLTDVDKVMEMILTESGCTHYIGYMKGKFTTTARLDINPEYKANRNKEQPYWWNDVQLRLQEHWNAHYVDYMEVDDAVNITRLALPASFICAIDGDLLGLEGTHYNWRKKEWTTVTDEEAAYKFWGDMIIGQPGDNIKGLPGKGEAYAKKLLAQPRMEGYVGLTFQAYVGVLGVDLGIKEFCKNWNTLKILDKFDGFVVPEPNEFKINKLEEETNLFT